nr:AraC family transcriptional regulator [Aquibacillus saliphilus]
MVLTPFQSRPLLPIYIESIGFNPHQEKITRPHGYPHYHWLQTIAGEGEFAFNGERYILKPNCGMLISPHVSHSYQALTDKWETTYLTFGGKIIADVMSYIGLQSEAFYQWESDNPIRTEIIDFMQNIEDTNDVFGIHASTNVYQFLLMVKNYAGAEKNLAVSGNLEKLQPLIKWMKANISNPNIGLIEFAQFLDISPRQLNGLFRNTFNVSPYAYFLDLRIRTAKHLLFESKEMTINQVAKEIGFRSPSHFIATFKKIVGIPPEKFRTFH